MALVVHKYGGTSMGSIDRIKNVARRVAKWHDAGYQVVVVPSAMAGETNRLIGLAKEIMPEPDQRELDMVTSTGEQVSIGLLSMALMQLGKEAVSFTGWQVPVKTDTSHTKARMPVVRESAKQGISQHLVVAVPIPLPWQWLRLSRLRNVSSIQTWMAYIRRIRVW